MRLRYLELLYIPSFFLTHASVFLGLPPVYAIATLVIPAVASLRMLLSGGENSKAVEALIIAGLFYSNLIPPWSGVLFMLMLLLMPESYVQHSRLSFAFRGVAFPALTLAFLSGWNAFGLAVLVYLVALLALSLKIQGVRGVVHEA